MAKPAKADGKKRVKAPVGRPPVITPEILAQLKTAFMFGCTNEEACHFAKTTPSVFYRYKEDKPQLQEEIDWLKTNPGMVAKRTLCMGVMRDPKLALEYLRNTQSDKFTTSSKTTLNVDESLADALFRISNNNGQRRNETATED